MTGARHSAYCFVLDLLAQLELPRPESDALADAAEAFLLARKDREIEDAIGECSWALTYLAEESVLAYDVVCGLWAAVCNCGPPRVKLMAVTLPAAPRIPAPRAVGRSSW